MIHSAPLTTRAPEPRSATPTLKAAAGSSMPASAPPKRLVIGPQGVVCGLTLPMSATGKPLGNAATLDKRGLILWFHGGMRGQNREKGLEAHRPLLSFVAPDAYYLASPSAFAGQDWLSEGGLAATENLLDYLIANYPIDTADINLMGVSDGCLAVLRYSQTGKRAINRRILVSSLPQSAVTLEVLPSQTRFALGRWDFLQGGQDRLFPARSVMPYLQAFASIFPNAKVHYYQEGEHDFSYYAEHDPDLLRQLLLPAQARARHKSRHDNLLPNPKRKS